MTIVHADASTLMKNLMRDNKDAQAEIYEGLTQRPKQAGTDCIAIPSIAGHFYIKNFKVKSSLPS
jgi:aspartate racemase